MSFSDLLELCLNLTDCVVLELFDFLECATDHTHSLWINTCCCKDLIDLCVLSLKTLLDRLKFLLKDKVTEACLLMKFINYLVELLKQLLLLGFQILVLLELDFVLPLKRLILLRGFCNLLLTFDEVFFDFIVGNLLLE